MRALPVQPSAAELMETLRQSDLEIEAERSSAARTLHDEIGGLLVGALMDMSWISQQQGQPDVIREKLNRAIRLVREGINVKRRLVEALRPSLLDDVGLCSTIRWHLKASCDAAGVGFSDGYPPTEPVLSSEFKIGVFRIFQKALGQILATVTGVPSEVSLQVEVIEDTLHFRIASHFLGSRPAVSQTSDPNTPLHHRIRQMGGACECLEILDGYQVNVTIPIPPRVLAAL
jgi:signal transduction histidine kinase